MQNRTIEPYVPPVFTAPLYAIAVNTLFFASLAVVLVAAVLCMLVKGWIKELDRKLRRIPDLRKRAVVKELREQGMLRWRLPALITILPALIHLSLVLFFIGLVVYLLQVHKLPAFLSIAIFGTWVFVYALSVLISAIDEFSPFRSSYSRMLGVLYRRLYNGVAGSLASRSTMALPRTTVEKIRERIIMFIQGHIPLSEETILEVSSSSSDKIISRTSVPILNKLFGSIAEWDASVYSKNVSACILLQLDDLNARSPSVWPFLLKYNTSTLSIKEAECLAYSICMQDHNIVNNSWKPVMEVLNQASDPWFNLVSSLLWVRCIDVRAGWSRIPTREADILRAISHTEHLTADKWCFALSAVSALFPRGMANAQQIRAFAHILARLLQKRVYYVDKSMDEGDGALDFWFYIMTSILDKDMPAGRDRALSSAEKFLHARETEVRGKGMTRDLNCIYRLFQLSRDHQLDPSLMRGCLVSIVWFLIRLSPSNPQEVMLVEQYLEVIEKEMDVAAWSFSLAEFFANQQSWPYGTSGTVLCLLKGDYINTVEDYYVDHGGTIIHEYDSKLTAANAQPTAAILEVINYVVSLTSFFGFEPRNAWLSLYGHNRTRSPHDSAAIPAVWASGCIPIASGRLDLYDKGIVIPELDLVTFFLSCPSSSIASRALHWYLRLEESALTRDGTRYLVPFSTIFREGLSVDEKAEGWLLLVDVLLPNWNAMPLDRRAHFVESFFGYGGSQGTIHPAVDQNTTSVEVEGEKGLDPFDTGIPASTARADGLGWMEDVWITVLRPVVREVHVALLQSYWSELVRVMPEDYPELAELDSSPHRSNNIGWDEASDGMLDEDGIAQRSKPSEEHLEATGRGLLGVLALLLEAGADSMPATLLDRVRGSPLLSDERLSDDNGSLSRIKAVLIRICETVL
jgi:hypothetical protein